jgi:5-methylthioribose kinase
LKTQNGPRVIDPEFAYFGRSEFDPAIFIAHLLLGRQPPELIELFLKEYRPPIVHDDKLMLRLAGVEVMRRLIGYAQLPLSYGGKQRKELLEISRQMVLRPDRNLLTTSRI